MNLHLCIADCVVRYRQIYIDSTLYYCGPKFDKGKCIETEVVMAVQINGKVPVTI